MAHASINEEEALGKAYDARLMRRLLRYVRPYHPLVAGALVLLFVEGALQLAGPLLTQLVIDVALPAGDFGLVRTAALLYRPRPRRPVRVLLRRDDADQPPRPARDAGPAAGDLRPPPAAVDVVLRPQSGRPADHAGDVGRGGAQRAVHRRGRGRTRRPVHARHDPQSRCSSSTGGWRSRRSSSFRSSCSPRNLFRVRVREAYREIRVRLARINAYLQERIAGMRVVQLFGREEMEAARFDALNRDHLRSHLRSITVYALYFPAIEVLTSVALASLIVAGAERVEAGVLTIGTVAAFLQLVRRFFQPLQDLSEKYNILQAAMASSERIFTLLDTEPGGAAGANGRESPAGRARIVTPPPRPRSSRGVTVAFEDVWFAYDLAHSRRGESAPREPEWVLRDVSFEAAPGRTTALVGHTGRREDDDREPADALLRSAAGTDHRRWGGHPRDAGRRAARAHRLRPAGHLPLRGGRRVEHPALRAADRRGGRRRGRPASAPTGSSAGSPIGTTTSSGSAGASLSVGERQLLSFARAVAADPALLLLDEATSAVDSEIEAEIQARAGRADAGPNDDRDRPSPEHDRGRGRDSRPPPRSDRGARDAPDAAREGGAVRATLSSASGRSPSGWARNCVKLASISGGNSFVTRAPL